jgi:hypothetical protein
MKATIINASAMRTSIAVWLRLKHTPQDAPIAWISAQLSPDSYATFVWETVYEFVWANTGRLASGKVVHVAERMDAVARSARLERSGDSYRLVAVPTGLATETESLSVVTNDDIPSGQLAVGLNIRIANGIGQPGNGVSVVQAQPNLVFNWTVGETYFACFGAIAQSEYDPDVFNTQTPLALDFSGQDEVAILLDSTNSLTQLKIGEAETRLASFGFSHAAAATGPPDCGPLPRPRSDS